MAWTEAPASGESRRSTVIPHAFRHRVSSRLYLSVDFVDGGKIPEEDIGALAVDRPTRARDHVRNIGHYGRFPRAEFGMSWPSERDCRSRLTGADLLML